MNAASAAPDLGREWLCECYRASGWLPQHVVTHRRDRGTETEFLLRHLHLFSVLWTGKVSNANKRPLTILLIAQTATTSLALLLLFLFLTKHRFRGGTERTSVSPTCFRRCWRDTRSITIWQCKVLWCLLSVVWLRVGSTSVSQILQKASFYQLEKQICNSYLGDYIQ